MSRGDQIRDPYVLAKGRESTSKRVQPLLSLTRVLMSASVTDGNALRAVAACSACCLSRPAHLTGQMVTQISHQSQIKLQALFHELPHAQPMLLCHSYGAIYIWRA